MAETKTVKPSFWRFGGRLDTMYNWLLVIFFVLFCIVQIPRYGGHLPEGLGAATGQTVFVAIVLFVVFKLISRLTRKT